MTRVKVHNTTFEASTEEGWLFFPQLESLDEIVQYTKPDGKRVLSVAAYGYPWAFLAGNAEEVVGFDVSEKVVIWNDIIATMITHLSFEENRAVMNTQKKAERTDLQDIIAEHCPIEHAEYVTRAFYLYKKRAYDLTIEEQEQYYPHLRDEKTFQKIRKAIQQKKHTVHHEEIGRLAKELVQNGEQFDIIYLSSIRQWLFDGYLGEHNLCFKILDDIEKPRRKELLQDYITYDETFMRSISQLLNKNGIVYSAMVAGLPCIDIFELPEPEGFTQEMHVSTHDGTRVGSSVKYKQYGSKENKIEILRKV